MKFTWAFLHSGEMKRREELQSSGIPGMPKTYSLVTLINQLLQSMTIFVCMSVTNKDTI